MSTDLESIWLSTADRDRPNLRKFSTFHIILCYLLILSVSCAIWNHICLSLFTISRDYDLYFVDDVYHDFLRRGRGRMTEIQTRTVLLSDVIVRLRFEGMLFEKSELYSARYVLSDEDFVEDCNKSFLKSTLMKSDCMSAKSTVLRKDLSKVMRPLDLQFDREWDNHYSVESILTSETDELFSSHMIADVPEMTRELLLDEILVGASADEYDHERSFAREYSVYEALITS